MLPLLRGKLYSLELFINTAENQSRLAFYYPMVGLINLFVSILKSPASLVAPSDVALMDIAVGHFGHLEFITTSELAFPFTREVAVLARETVKKARERSTVSNTGSEANWNNGVWNSTDVDLWNDVSRSCNRPQYLNNRLTSGSISWTP